MTAIEIEANANAARNSIETVDGGPNPSRRLVRNTPARHALATELRSATRQALRVRKVALALMICGLVISVAAIAALRLNYPLFGMVGLIISGFVIGFAGVSLYKANQRMQYATAAYDGSFDEDQLN